MTYAELAKERDELKSENATLRSIMDMMLEKGKRLEAENEELKKGSVRHAKWVRVNDGENVYYMCDGKDGCGCCIQVTRGTPIDNDLGFCPHCGAKMDEGELP